MGELESAIEIIQKCEKSNIENDMIKLKEKIENKIKSNKNLKESIIKLRNQIMNHIPSF